MGRFAMEAQTIGLIGSFVLYGIACALPALEFKNSQGPNDIMFGARALAVGWSGIFAGVFAWYANPVWLLGLGIGFLRKPVPLAILGVLAVVIAYSTVSMVGREMPGDEGNVTKTTVIRLLPGFYVWMASLALLPVVALLPRGK